MALTVKDRVRETTATTGTGTLTLSGAVAGYQTFSSAIGNTNTTYYSISSTAGSEWEVGLGTVGAGTLSRDTIISSSNAGSAVTFSAGTKDVYCVHPASKSVLTDGTQATGTWGISITGSAASATGNAATATALQTTRAINGVNFDGTAAITVTAAAGTLSGATLNSSVTASSLTSVGTLATLTVTATITGSISGNAATATNVAASGITGATLAAGVTASSLTSVGTLASLTVTATITGSVSGNSGTTSQRTFSNVRTDGINRGSYGSISIAGNTNTYAGIDFTDYSSTLMISTGGFSGVYYNNTTWIWYFNASGVLTVGTVPNASVTGLGTLATQNGTFSGTSSGTNTGDQTTVSGNAGTATALQTARLINTVSFNGTTDITITAAAGTLTGGTLNSGVTASSLTSVGTLTSLTLGGSSDFVNNQVDRAKFKSYSEIVGTPSISSGTLTLDLSTANTFRVSKGTAVTTLTISNPPASGIAGSFTLIFDTTGSFAVTWPASVHWAGGTAPTLSTVTSKTDILTFVTTNAGTTWYGFVGGLTFVT